jgi:rRNA maturation RNase YbeY
MPASIYFHNEDIKFRKPPAREFRSWLTKVAKAERRSIGSLNYIFCSDRFLSKLNTTYLGHDTLTDIITFENAHESNDIEGDIYISIERVKENALRYDVTFREELRRVMVHGLLHLVGYGDKTAKEKKLMRKKESAYISL